MWSWREQSGLKDAITLGPPWLLDRLEPELFVPPSAYSFVAGPFFRPPGSHRSFYEMPQLEDPESAAGVLAYKGTEPLVPGRAELLRHFARSHDGDASILEQLIVGEGKVPGALTLGEALREAEASARLQLAHVARYGTLARLPLPLHVMPHDQGTAAALLELLAPVVSSAARAELERIASPGLAVLVYHYPAPPLRVRDVASLFAGMNGVQRLLGLLDLCDAKAAVEGWLELFSRVLTLGFVPGTPGGLRTGLCCQPQNACLDGGFVDLESAVAINGLPDDGAVAAAVHASVGALVETVVDFLLPAGGRRDGMARHHVTSFVLDRLARAVDVPRSDSIDPRVTRQLKPPGGFAELLDRLAVGTDLPDPLFVESARDFAGFVRRLVSPSTEAR